MRARTAVLAAACAAALAGCGGSAGDLLAVESAGGPRADVDRLVITDDGRARCDGGELREIRGDELIEARELARELSGLAEQARTFAPPPGERRRYVARVREGNVRWSEGAAGLPEALPRVELLALRLGRELCR